MTKISTSNAIASNAASANSSVFEDSPRDTKNQKHASVLSLPSLAHGFTCNYMSIRPKNLFQQCKGFNLSWLAIQIHPLGGDSVAGGSEIYSALFTRTTVIFSNPSSNTGGLSFSAILRMMSSLTERSRWRLRSRHTSSGTSKKTA